MNVLQSINYYQTENTPLIFGATYMILDPSYFLTMNMGLNEIIQSHGDKLVTLDPQLDQEKQNEQILAFIKLKVSIIFLNPVNWITVKPALLAANEAGIPVFNLDSPVFDEELVTTIVMSDNYKIGIMVANAMMERVEEAKIVIIDYPAAKATIDRIQGFKDTIQNKPQYEIVIEKSEEGAGFQSKILMEEAIEEQPDFNVVYGTNDSSALGAIEALQEADRIEGTLVFGVDGTPRAKLKIKEGLMTATVAQSPLEMGMTAAEMGYVYLEGNPVPKIIYTPIYLIDQENINDYDIISWQ
ncbi:substrate-binding domain-containing protein [Anaerosacchariphilus polymeriproducens]|uniref:Sugar ABC transporter substrate-binding protein n=1 Tax=Anaerosacchariphilus polymeriproducens TaxID=1812858 RepID=A0A371AXQ6_9FIRM|nr:substrate-binding domain-containing protein [Anaerosacchariphilus polymeriproducens]RDU24363.1 sugar ABC transporter substrate-binding protein [Anaerosacchariphilus polymeriproducens]